MSVLSRDFTRREKILLMILCLILLGLIYYQLVDQPVRSAVDGARAEKEALQTELDAVYNRILRLKQMKQELDGIDKNADRMPSYNNSEAEVALLNDILKDTQDYTISFSDVTRDGDQIRRNFALQFTTDGFAAVEQVISRLTTGEYRCLLDDLRCTAGEEAVSVNMTATFYETMVGGRADAGLPRDASAGN